MRHEESYKINDLQREIRRLKAGELEDACAEVAARGHILGVDGGDARNRALEQEVEKQCDTAAGASGFWALF